PRPPPGTPRPRGGAPRPKSPPPAPPVPAALSQVWPDPPVEAAAAEPRVEPPSPPSAPAPPAPPPGDPFAPARVDPQRRAGGRERNFDSVWAPEPGKPVPAAVRPAPEVARETESVALRPPREPPAGSALQSGPI